jgi:hypothetical protein
VTTVSQWAEGRGEAVCHLSAPPAGGILIAGLQ